MIASQPAVAQITPDATLGNESSVVLPVDAVTNRIEQGAIRGSALFHSFQEFNVNEGHSAYFASPAGITNILSRVTGNDVSDILGTLGVEGTANLFFLNPNGIVFGPNAQLDIAGTAVFSTGDRFSFADSNWFSATTPNAPPLLTMNVTPGLQLGAGQAAIANDGQLSVGQDLTLHGSSLEVSGQLIAGVDLSLLAEDTITVRDTPTEVFMAQAGGNLTLRGNQGIDILALQHLEQTPFVSGGDLIFISDGVISADAHFDSEGALQFLTTTGLPANVVSLYDPIMTPDGGLIMGDYTGAALKVETNGDIQMGNITITGPDTTLDADGSGSDEDLLASNRAAILRAGVNEAGNQIGTQPSNIVVGNIDTSDGTGGDGGPIILAASGDIETRRLHSGSFSDFGDTGNGGEIIISSLSGNITNCSTLSDSYSLDGGAGNGGMITISAQGDVINPLISSSSRSSKGNASNGGPITISTQGDITTSVISSGSDSRTLGNAGNGGEITIFSSSGRIINNGGIGSVSQSSDGNAGNGGNIAISAQKDINTSPINSSSRSPNSDSGNGGNITIFAQGDINARQIEAISSSQSPDGNAGNGGTITILSLAGDISTNNINTDSRSPFRDTGNGGEITISAQGDINIQQVWSRSSTNGGASENGGDVTIFSQGDISTLDIRTDSFSSRNTAENGGEVTISAGENINIDGIFSDSYGGEASGNAGAITISAREDITISARRDPRFLPTISASSSSTIEAGNGGMITISTLIGNIIIGENIDSSAFSFSRTAKQSGNGGKIIITTNSGEIIGNDSNLFSFSVSERGTPTGNGGDVRLGAQSNISGLSIFTLASSGNAGTVNIEGEGNLLIRDIQLVTTGQVEIPDPIFPSRTIIITLDNLGQSGNIMIRGLGNLIFEDVEIQASANSRQPAGNVTITNPNQVTFRNSQINSNANNAGNAGEIRIDTRRLNLGNGGQIFAETSGSGDGGDITINATDTVFLGEGVQDFAPVISVEASDAGRPGNITINTPNFVLSETARITATASETATNFETGGSIILNADRMDLAGTVGIFAETQGQAPGGVLTLQPYQTNQDLQVTLAPDAVVSASTISSGSGGGLAIRANGSVTISGPGRLAVESSGSGPAGNIDVTTQRLTLADGVILSASARGSGRGGNINLMVPEVISVQGNSRIAAETTGAGTGGTLTVDTGSFHLADGAIVSARSNIGADGDAGNITIAASDNVTLSEASEVSVETNSQGAAGDITINTPLLTIESDAAVTATATSNAAPTSQGGSIFLNATTMDLEGRVGVFSETRGEAPAGRLELKPLGNALDLDITLRSAARVSASTTSLGQGGDLSIAADESITIRGDGQVAVETTGAGNAGTLKISTRDLTIDDGALLTAASDGIGAAGSVNLDVERLTLRNGAQASVSSNGTALAGDLKVTAEQISLTNGAALIGETEVGSGANIDLEVNDRLQLQDNSRISVLTASGTGGDIRLRELNTLQVYNSQILATAEAPMGTAGKIEVNASDSVVLNGRLNRTERGGISVAATGGNAGSLILTTADLTIQDGAELSVSNTASGQAGNLIVNADTIALNQDGLINAQTEAGQGGNVRLAIENTVQLQNQSVISATTQSGMGGRIDIFNADTIEVRNSQISATADSPTGTAGAIEVNASDAILLSGQLRNDQRGGISVSAVGGDAGALTLTTGDLTIREGAELSVRNRASGQAGNLVVTADNVTLEQAGRINAQTEAGQGGNIRLEVEEALVLQNRGVISATTQAGTGGRIDILDANTVEVRDSQITATANRPKGTAGAVEVNASDSIVLAGRLNGDQRGGVSVSAVGGNAGALQLNTSSLTIQDGAEASVSNTGTGQAGNLIVRADTVWLQRDGLINAETDAGQRGNVRLRVSDLLSLEQGSAISAATQSGRGGSIVIEGSNQVNVDNSTITSSAQTGRAGNVSIEARDSVTLSNNAVLSVETRTQQDSSRTNNRSNLRLAEASSRVATTTTIPQAGNLSIDSEQLLVNDGSSIFIRSLNGIAGNIDMVVSQVKLDDGQIRATTAENPNSDTLSANITMSNLDFLSLDNGSLISAEAQPGANGGNIRLNAEGGIIIATPNSNSDIIATAVDGTGGQIQITALQLLNLQESPGDFSSLRGDSTNDISVDSVSGIDGDIEVDVNPFEVAVDLPVDTAPPALSQGCQPGNDGRGMFVNTGQGGIAINPDDPISGDRPWEDITPPKITDEVVEVTEAEMWQVNENGQIILNAASRDESISLTCQS